MSAIVEPAFVNPPRSLTPGLPAHNGSDHPNGSQHPASDFNIHGKRIQELIARVESLPEASARELLHECLESLLGLYGEGLARVLQLVGNSGINGENIRRALLNDDLLRGLLLIHGLHPDSLEIRLHSALEKVRPYLKSHGGDVELINLENDVARLRLQGTCKSCPSSSITLELAVRNAIEESCPDLVDFEVEGVGLSNETKTHLPANAPQWTVIDDFGELRDGEMRYLQVAAVPVLIVKACGNLYAYRDHCPECNASLNSAILESKIIICRLGHRFDVQRAGQCPHNPQTHLEPFPLLAVNGMVKISVR